MCVLTIKGDGHRLMARAITMTALKELDLKPDDAVVALIKSTETLFLKGDRGDAKLSARNQIEGQVTSVQKGQAMAVVNIDAGPFQLTSAITRQAADDLQINMSDRVLAIVKATDVIVQKG